MTEVDLVERARDLLRRANDLAAAHRQQQAATHGDPAERRELLGRLVRQVWVEWAREQPDAKPSWLLAWEDLDDRQREVDMRIGETLFEQGKEAAIRWQT